MDNEYNYRIYENKFGKYAVPEEVDHRPCVKENIISLGYKFKKEIEKNKVWMIEE